MAEFDHTVYSICRHGHVLTWSENHYKLPADKRTTHQIYWQFRSTVDREALRSAFHEIVGFVLSNQHILCWSKAEPDLLNYSSSNDKHDEQAFAEIEPWLQEHCPSFTRLGPLIGIQDEDEAFAFKLRFG